ncbi:MAG TPA: response regulator [Chthoniobacteraceae bacterium]|nr:response regulator [Chthoniobacteraceae bacterium]
MQNVPNHSNQSNSQKSYSVVIAEDDRIMADLMAMNLRRLGHRVAGIAANGKEAVTMALKTRPDVMVMDIHMPILDGFQAAREILTNYPVPVVLMSGMSDARAASRAADLNIISYLVKPFSPAQLKIAVHLAVAQFRGLAASEIVSAA